MSTAEITAPATPAHRGTMDRPLGAGRPGVLGEDGQTGGESEPVVLDLRRAHRVLDVDGLVGPGALHGPAYGIDPAGKFLLVSLPSLIGALIRIPYTMAPARFGGRNWTIVSALLLLIPTALAIIVMHPGTSFTTFMIVAALGGLGGGNFASSMTNINAFFPEGRKGWALGLNAGGGNIGVAAVQLLGLLVIATVGAA